MNQLRRILGSQDKHAKLFNPKEEQERTCRMQGEVGGEESKLYSRIVRSSYRRFGREIVIRQPTRQPDGHGFFPARKLMDSLAYVVEKLKMKKLYTLLFDG